MKPTTFFTLQFLIIAFILLFAHYASGQTSGTWGSTAGGNWNLSTNWVGGNIASGTDALADFSQTLSAARTLTVNANFTVGSLKFGSGANSTLAASGGSILTLQTSTGSPTIDVAGNVALISAKLAGTQGFNLTGAGALRLTGTTNTLTGGIRLGSASELQFNANTLGTNVVDFTANSTLTWNGTNTQDVSSLIKIEDGVTATLGIGANNVTFATALQTGAAGTGAITKTGAGTVTITAANTYTGLTRISAGRIVLSGADNRLATTGTISLGATTNSGVLQLGDASGISNQTTTSLIIAGTGTSNAAVGGNASISTLTVNNSAAVTYAGLLGGAGANENNLALTKAGAGALTLSNAASTFTGGVNLGAGTLSFVSGALGTSGLITFTATSSLQWNGTNTQDVSSRLKINDGVIATFDTNGNNVTLASALQTGALGTGALTKGGLGNLTITAANTYTGNTRINNGRVILSGGDGRLSSSTALQFGSTANSGVLQLGDASGASNQAVTGLSVTGGTSSLSNAIVGGNASVSTLTVNNATSVTWAQALGGVGTNENSLALSKSGAGTLTLSGTSNSFTGDVNISGGALIIKNSSALGSGTKNITVVGATNTPSLQLSPTSGGITLDAGLSLITSNQNSTAPAILSSIGDNIINGTISPTNGGSGTGSTRIMVSAGSTLTLNGNIAPASSATSARTLILGGAGNGTVNGTLANGGFALALSKDGAGKWSLNAANTFTGIVSILAGALEVGNTIGSATGTGAVTVSSGATLEGNGRIGGVTTVQSGGSVEGGLEAATGKLTFTNRLNILDGGVANFHLASSSSYDQLFANQLSVGATSSSTASFRVILDNGYAPAPGDSFKLLDWTTLLPGDTNLADNLDLSSATLNPGLIWDVSAFHGSGVISVLAPEPGRALLLGIGGIALGLRRRRASSNY